MIEGIREKERAKEILEAQHDEMERLVDEFNRAYLASGLEELRLKMKTFISNMKKEHQGNWTIDCKGMTPFQYRYDRKTAHFAEFRTDNTVSSNTEQTPSHSNVRRGQIQTPSTSTSRTSNTRSETRSFSFKHID